MAESFMTVQQWCRLLFGLGGELLVLIYAPCLLIWSIMIGLKLDGYADISWWNITIPMFFAAASTAYVLLVASARMAVEEARTVTRKKGFFGFAQGANALIFTFLILLCSFLEDNRYSRVNIDHLMSPLIALSCMQLIRAFVVP
eukprot:gene1636-4770_t